MKSIYLFFLLLFVLAGCQRSELPTIKIAATAIPHAEILESVQPLLEEKGIHLEIIVVDDYNTPNRALNEGEIDANFFQHLPFLKEQMKDFGYRLEPFIPIHIEPMSIYSKKINHLKDLVSGATIAIPSDPTNQARALLLLQKEGLIKLSRSDTKASLLDVKETPYQLVEIDSPLLVRSLDDVVLAVITTNFALQAALDKPLATEDRTSDFVNYVVIRSGESDREDLKQLKNAFKDPSVAQFIERRYQGRVKYF